MTRPKVDFYGRTPLTKPILAYRMAVRALQEGEEDRRAVLDGLVERLLTSSDEGFRQFKFFTPERLKAVLTPEELAEFDARLEPRRARAKRLKMVYPDSSDEFSLDHDFLASVLDVDHGPTVREGGSYFTIGSCFAHNIATYLTATGHQAVMFPMAEDLNSPLSNAFVLDLLTRSRAERLQVMSHWVRRSFPEMAEADVAPTAVFKLRKVETLQANLAETDCVVMTLGNVVDFFLEGRPPSLPVMEKVFPLYAAMPTLEEQNRAKAVAILKKQGAGLRLATTEETREAIALCVAGIRAATRAPIVITVSPVPVSSALSVGGTSALSAIEADCVSKSRLRAALDDVLPELRATHGGVFYYPAFEIVRWISPALPLQVFGRDDGGARHPSQPVVEAVCSLFVDRFVRRGDPAAEAAAEALEAGS